MQLYMFLLSDVTLGHGHETVPWVGEMSKRLSGKKKMATLGRGRQEMPAHETAVESEVLQLTDEGRSDRKLLNDILLLTVHTAWLD